MIAKKNQRSKKLRNTLIIAGGITAVGIGTYFGVRKTLGPMPSLGEIRELLRKIELNTENISKDSDFICTALEYEQDYRQRLLRAIDVAITNDVEFDFFPGLGVRFLTPEDQSKVFDAIKKAA